MLSATTGFVGYTESETTSGEPRHMCIEERRPVGAIVERVEREHRKSEIDIEREIEGTEIEGRDSQTGRDREIYRRQVDKERDTHRDTQRDTHRYRHRPQTQTWTNKKRDRCKDTANFFSINLPPGRAL